MSNEYRRDFETVEEYRNRLERDAQYRASFEPDMGKVLEQPPRPQIVIKPGYQHARRAYELGMEDEYSNRMKARFGGEW